MTKKRGSEPTLRDVILSINGMRTQISDMSNRIDGMATKADLESAVCGLATKNELDTAVAGLATKEELDSALADLATKDELSRLEAVIKREAEDLGESISSLSTMVAERLDPGPAWRKYKLW